MPRDGDTILNVEKGCLFLLTASVRHTINRRGVYYLNLRWNNQVIRQSLATKDPMEAFEKVNQLAPLFSKPQTCLKTSRH